MGEWAPLLVFMLTCWLLYRSWGNVGRRVGSLFSLGGILVLAIAVLVLCHLTADFCHLDSYAWHRLKISQRESKKRCQRRSDTNPIRFDIVASFLLIPLKPVSWTWLESCHIEFFIPHDNPLCKIRWEGQRGVVRIESFCDSKVRRASFNLRRHYFNDLEKYRLYFCTNSFMS